MDEPAKAYSYQELVEATAHGIPTFDPLKNFLLDANDSLECQISLIEFEDHQPQHNQGCHKSNKEKIVEPRQLDPRDLEIELQNPNGHRLLLIENLTPKIIILLGQYWNVPPDFFLAHLENSNWYNLQNIPQNLPGLSSVQCLNGYVRFQFIGPREFGIEGSSNAQPPGSFGDHNLLPDRIHEDPQKASVPRVAGGFTPFPPPQIDPDDVSETKINPVAFVRNSVTIWFDQEGERWEKGIVLFDPHFVAKDQRFRNKENSKYRSFIHRRSPPYFSNDDIDHRVSYKKSFEKCLQKNQHIRETAIPKPFVLLEDLCRIIASEWLVFNTYIERELNNIEGWFEELGENCNEKQLHDLLHQLMRIRRRVTKYDTLVSDQLQLCPAHWSSSSGSSCPVTSGSHPPPGHCPISSLAQPATNRFSSPLRDFHQVSNHLAHNKTRISQAIKMVTSLMTVRLNSLVAKQSDTLVKQNELILEQNKVVAKQSDTLVRQNHLLLEQNREVTKQSMAMFTQNRLSEARNSSLAFLTGVTSFLLPFTTVAAFMAIPIDSGIGPRSKKQ